MTQTSREIVRRCVTFQNPERMPRDLWVLPWTEINHPERLKKLKETYPSDFAGAPGVYNKCPNVKGDPYKIGEFVDEWGCVFENLQAGVIGEVKDPILKDIADYKTVVKPPYEALKFDYNKARDIVNRYCASTDKYVAGGCCPRPWERSQFILGTENAMIDLMLYEKEYKGLLKILHDFFMKELEFWASTDVDGLMFMDDWGAQNQLLIRPELWVEYFKPLYKEYSDLAHSKGKFLFMHSDGNITDIYPHLIDIKIDAVNSQLFCMDMEKIAKIAKGKITFWGEIDRQHVMISKDLQVGRDAVRKVAKHLYDPKGGIISQFELGPGSNPEIGFAIFDEWEKVQGIRK